MSLINELKYNTNDFTNIDIGDMIVVFEGDITIVHSSHFNEEELKKVKALLYSLCEKFYNVSSQVLKDDGNIKDIYTKNNYQNINYAILQFAGFPNLLIGEVEEDDYGFCLTIDNTWYDVLNSKELYQLIKTNLLYKNFTCISINDEKYTLEDIASFKPEDIPLANPLYHGTIEKYLPNILQKGLRKIQDNSIFNAMNEGFVFLTSDYNTAKEYAGMYSKKFKSKGVVLQIDSNHIDKNKIVLDYDFVYSFGGMYDKSPYTGNEIGYNKHYKGKTVDVNKSYGTKYGKIGYKGIIMPNAIKKLFLIYPNGYEEEINKEKYLNDIKQENVVENKLNEWYFPENFNELPDKITLYHGTDYYGLEEILESGVIDARNGHRSGETKGMNWFSTVFSTNYSRGFVFSIEIHKNEINKHSNGFKYMNGRDIANYEPIDISNRNFTLVEAFDKDFNMLNHMWKFYLKRAQNDEYEAMLLLAERLSKDSDYDITIDNTIFQQLLSQIIGKDKLYQYGIIENKINESPDRINVLDCEDECYNGSYKWNSNDAIPFIIDTNITQVYIGDIADMHSDIMYEKIYDSVEEITWDDIDDKWKRENSFHGRLWIEPKIISIWNQPSQQQMLKILRLLQPEINKFSEDFPGEDINLNNFRLEISEGEFIPIKEYIGMSHFKNNNFDTKTLHLMNGEEKRKDPQMQSYLKNRSQSQSEKLGLSNNNREVTPAEYNYYKRYNMGENINEVNANDINLKSFEPKNSLHPKIWINNKLNSRIRLKLLNIADDFIDTLAVDWVKPEDIVFTGSLANYNWSKHSDIDIHVMMDYNKVYRKKEFVEDYFNAKKESWLENHPDLKIYGFPVELYVEDTNGDSVSSGIYSLNKNKWIKEPSDFQDVKLNEKYIKRYASELMNQIDDLIQKHKNEKDEHKLEKISNKLKSIFDKIKKLRTEGLTKKGEMSSGNIIYKIIKRSDYFDKLWEIVNKSYDKINSIK